MSKKIKSLSAVILITVITSFSATAGGGKGECCKKSSCAKEQKAELKDHTCTQACHDKGSCVLVCGEKGHTCTEACKKE